MRRDTRFLLAVRWVPSFSRRPRSGAAVGARIFPPSACRHCAVGTVGAPTAHCPCAVSTPGCRFFLGSCAARPPWPSHLQSVTPFHAMASLVSRLLASPCSACFLVIAHPCLTSPWTPTQSASQMARRHPKRGCTSLRLVHPSPLSFNSVAPPSLHVPFKISGLQLTPSHCPGPPARYRWRSRGSLRPSSDSEGNVSFVSRLSQRPVRTPYATYPCCSPPLLYWLTRSYGSPCI
ncbi:hypothetical protein EDB85DRAFT_65604 [Lactarius pseudohatsudake]|nr:hypothetical protein EDB85DRAFT_65604 [Lactarius pseudohatsudake]